MPAATAAQLLEALGPACRDSTRRGLLLGQGVLNGIDFVEYERRLAPDEQHVVHILHVHFLLPIPSADPYGLVVNPGAIKIHGGARIAGIKLAAPPAVGGSNVLDLRVDRQGDFSPYLLAVGWTRSAEGVWRHAFDALDRLFSVAPVNFRPGCAVDFDCLAEDDCPPRVFEEPVLDYLAKDYASFRQMLLDLVAQRHPAWTERSPADLGIALLELFAYEGDHLSYFQDAVANEAFLDTARQRVSAKRHAKLVDYRMHDGRNAWTFVHVRVAAKGTIGPGAQLLTRIATPLRFDRDPAVAVPVRPTAPPGAVLNPITDEDHRTDPALAQVRVFETAVSAGLSPLNNELRLHAWGNHDCCLPRGSTSAHVYAVDAAAAAPKAVMPPLKEGDHILLEEMLGPDSGKPTEADPAHRQVVEIEHVGAVTDTLFLAELDTATGEPKPASPPATPATALPLCEVTWRRADALEFPLCLAATLPDGRRLTRVSVARGNLVLADHGRTVDGESYDYARPLTGASTFRLRLRQAPQTMQIETGEEPAAFPPVRERPVLRGSPRDAVPAVAIRTRRGGVDTGSWWPVPDLLGSTQFQHHFVADVDGDGRAVLRFGDGEYGERLVGADRIEVWYRVGNGRTGNIGAEALAHIVKPAGATGWPTVTAVRNPLPARGGTDAERIDHVREYAPAEFRSRQLRAVTASDYEAAALTIDGVAGAVASFRWTGSWYTVFVGIDPADAGDVVQDPRGTTRLSPAFSRTVHDGLSRYRLAGYDIEIRAARYVPLDLAVHLCARPGYFRGDVAHAVTVALGRLFDPVHLTFGQAVQLSRIYEAIEGVAGVESATVTVFRRHGAAPAGELERGSLPIGPWEIARLDNDASEMENGTLTITAGGGS
jgi:hypothetical protein